MIHLIGVDGALSLYDPEASQEQNSGVIATVQPDQSFGQTFVSRRDRLDGVGLRLGLVPGTTDLNGSLLAELYHSPQEVTPLASTRISYRNISGGNLATVKLPPQTSSASQSYYLKLSTRDGAIEVFGRGEDVYSQGNAYTDDEPLLADAAFHLSYQYGWQGLLEDITTTLRGSWLIIPLCLMLFLPGFLALDVLGIGRDLGGAERLALWLGFSMAAIPVVMTWTSLAGLRWGSTGLWITAGILCAATLWRVRSSLLHPRLNISGTGLALGGIFLASLLVRVAMVRDLSAPAWVDSVHHGLITRLILEGGGFPESYRPYIDISSAQYHAGFHSLLAVFTWLTALELPGAMLIFGQVLNALSVLAMYLLATNLTGNRQAGVLAALLCGLFTPMPAYYSSWGRYTHLAGLLIIPTAFVLTRQLIDHRQPTSPGSEGPEKDRAGPTRIPLWKGLLVAGVCGAGLFLVHYRVSFFLACLVLAYLLVRAITERHWRSLPGDLGVSLLAALAAFVLLLPWTPATVSTLILPYAIRWSGEGAGTYNTFAWNYLTAGLGNYTLILAGLGFVLALLRRGWFALTLLIWTGLLFAAANLDRLNIPGSGFINNTSVQISLFIPISVLGGYFLAMLVSGLRLLLERLPTNQKRGQVVLYALVCLICAGATIRGARTLIPLLNPVTFLYRQADQAAMEWIEENIPPGETILVNTFSWGYGLFAGSDGGYWISPLAGIQTMPPPVLYGMSHNIAEVSATNQLSQQIIDKGNQPRELAALMRQAGLRYIYIGAKGGALSARNLLESGLFQALYQTNGAWLLKAREASP